MNQRGLDLHIARAHAEKYLRCCKCEKSFATEDGLATHMATHDTKPLKCDDCGHMFAEAMALASHKRFHDPSRPHVCQVRRALTQELRVITKSLTPTLIVLFMTVLASSLLPTREGLQTALCTRANP